MAAEPADAAFYPGIETYAVLADGHTAALVSRAGAIDFCCLPRFDSGTCFGRLLDWTGGGAWTVEGARTPLEPADQAYLDATMVVRTELAGEGGRLALTDLLVDGEEAPHLLRVLDGLEGEVELVTRIVPRFDYGQLPPWLHAHGDGRWIATGGDDALLLDPGEGVELELEPDDPHALRGCFTLREGDRIRLSVRYRRPHELDHPPPRERAEDLDRRLADTVAAWRGWAKRARLPDSRHAQVLRSALVIKGLTYEASGAIVAAATTSLPEAPEGDLNWDYRYSWIRDAAFCVRSLTELGYDEEAARFRRFVERSAAGDAHQLRIAYGVLGERRLDEHDLGTLAGWRGARPVRAGNAAVGQLQLGIFGMLLDLAWRASEEGRAPDAAYTGFLVSAVERARELWTRADAGLWEQRGAGRHFTHSKVMCWVALDRGLELAQRHGWDVPADTWRTARDTIRAVVERDGFDHRRGTFVQVLGGADLDATALLFPRFGFLADDDPRMVSTVDVLREELGIHGLLYRQSSSRGREGAFLACSFWLVECLAAQGRLDEAEKVFERAARCANRVGILPEEWQPDRDEGLGNLPQGLSHYAHISAALALAGHGR